METTEDFYPASEVTIVLANRYGQKYTYNASIEENVVFFSDEGVLPIGVYNLEVTCLGINQEPFRYKQEEAVVVHDVTAAAGIEAGVEFDAETHTLEGVVFFYAKGDKGDKGEQGEKGDKGAVFTPHLDNEGNLSWTNDGGYENPETKNIRGPQGPKGDKGDKGDTFTYEDMTEADKDDLRSNFLTAVVDEGSYPEFLQIITNS